MTIYITDTGQVYPIINDEGEIDEAVQAVAGCDTTWFTFDPRDNFDTVSVH